jgi:hypothetical protein
MTETYKILLTAAATLFGGCLLYFLTHVISDLVIKPYIEFRKLLGEISYNLVYYANVLTNPPDTAGEERFREATDTIRRLSASLRAAAAGLPEYRLLAITRSVPSRKTIHTAGGLLIRISNSGNVRDKVMVHDDIKEVGHLLKIDVGRSPEKKFKRTT